jgi:regulation of enolase protein 1 (concanavalin A-like superfamily)
VLRLGRQGGALLVSVVCALIAGPHSLAAQTSTLPSGWTNRDIGNPVVAGSAESSAGTITVRGAGVNIWGTSDQFHFAYQAVSGDFDIRVRAANFQAADPWAKAGLMIRESLSATAKNAFMLLSAQQGVALQWRSLSSGATARVMGAAVVAPVWIRLVRKGDVFSAYRSPTGATWTLVGSVTIGMSANAYVGLAVTSRDPNQTATATFSSLVATSVPAPWRADDVGSPGLTGSATASSGVFTVKGSGPNICCASDQFQYVYQPVTGDTQIVAFVASLQAAAAWSKAGVMIRAALTGPSAHAFMFATASNGFGFRSRLSAGSWSYDTPGSAGGAPGWVRLEREGNLFSAYQSQDGSHWTLVGTDTISMPATVYVGLAVTSATVSATATAKFSNVAVSKPTSGNTPPTVSISSPITGASYTAPAQISINATAGDVDGSVTRVDFYAGTQLVGSDTASPFSATWSNVPAGTYSLTAVATDNEGATTTSAPVTVAVAAAVQVPTKLVFVPPTDYAANVTSFTVELRGAGDSVTVSPVATRNLGKPAVVSGEISVDISTLVDPLSAGSYYAIVVTTGPGGSTPSSPSAAFSK